MDKNRILIELSESTRTHVGRVEFADQPDAQRVFSAIWALESQVNNGGFLQYFESPDGETAEYAPSALRAIGAQKCAAIVERALRTVSESPLPASHDEREALVLDLSETIRNQLESLDQQFFAYPDDLTDLLFAYVVAHPESFGPVQIADAQPESS